MKYPHLFSPYRIKNTLFRNRIFTAPNGTKHKTADGYPVEFEIAVFEARAKGGTAQVTTGNSSVDSRYRDMSLSQAMNNIGTQEILPTLTEIALAVRRHGAVASFYLNHPGPKSQPHLCGHSPIGPTGCVRADGVEVLEMTEQDIEEAIEAFANAALTGKTCLFDMCMIQGGHGWLIGSFFSALSNKRTDKWGGSTENRARFAVEICKRIREKCGENFLIEFRMSATEFVEGGITLEEAIDFAKYLEPHIDLLHVSAAGLSTVHHNPDEAPDAKKQAETWKYCPTPHILEERGCYIDFAAAIKRSGVRTPIVAVGAIADPAMAEEAIAQGKCDFVAMARALLADPELPNKAKAGRIEDIRPCIRCEKCNDRHVSRQCTVNPEMGRYVRMLYVDKHPEPKKVAVIGGGPGGMQAAITAGERGHDVTLFESSDRLGGMLNVLCGEFLKREMKPYLDYLVRKTNAAAKVRLNTEITPEIIAPMGFDYIIAAVGADPVIPDIPGVGGKSVVTAPHIHDEGVTIGERVVIIGGGMSGCEIAYELSRQGRKVTLIARRKTFFPERDVISRNYSMPIFTRLHANENVTICPETVCTRISEGKVELVCNGEAREVPADTVVLATGMKAKTELVDALWNCAPNFRPIGDCLSPRYIIDATSEAFFAALDIG